ncbi:MAG TPA: peptidoglycan bridge formation glycyltransferase FemA/FemB family protein [Candidatus Limnocylindrales bacterium]|nr:peptidoglycan bridge formation glycyltransferase FemA/FemB family protein [Candidatus Limnocylindrales bacterium]
MADIQVAEATDDLRPAWTEFIAGRPEADFLQAWAWGEVAAGNGEEPLRLVARSSDGRIRGVAQVLIRPTSLGRTVAYAPHGPVWEREAADAHDILERLLEGLRAAGKQQRAIVVKVDPRGDGAPEAAREELRRELLSLDLKPAREDLQAVTTRVVELGDGGEALLETWNANARRDLRRGLREGVVTKVLHEVDQDAIDTFSKIWDETAARSSFKRRSNDFLRNVADAFGPAGDWTLVLASKDGEPLGGLVALRVGNRGYYVYAASTRAPAAKHASPGYVSMAALMDAFAGEGVSTLDLWGVAEEDSEHAEAAWAGFSFFKRRLGGEPVTHLGTFDLVIDPVLYKVRDLREQLRSSS